MRLSLVKSKNTTQFYVIESYRNINGKNTSKIIEKLGNTEDVLKKSKGQDPIEWAKKYVENLRKSEKHENIKIDFSPTLQISKNRKRTFNCGYLFLQDIYHKLKLDKTCKEISRKYKFEYDLNSVLSRLIYARILQPSSKLSSFEFSKELLEQPNFELQHVYRALEVICKESEFIEECVYKASLDLVDRNTKILYYDCTNYFFESEYANGIKQYGISKEHRPNPIVQMGLFMDGNGFPLAFCINPGNTNEQVTLKPLEKRIIKDFNLSTFVVCTDAGLASNENREFNNIQNRSFIVTQSLKKIKGHLKDWALDMKGWHLLNSIKEIDLATIDCSSSNENIYYKERWIKENGLEQRLIVSYSPKYAAYQKEVRNSQIARAQAIIDKPSKITKANQNDYKRFLKTTNITNDGEIAEKKNISLNTKVIEQETMFDGFYAVCTTLEDDISEIIKINKRRWEIEESFRILKSEFDARPIYLSLEERIRAHFTICFLSLLIYRILENKLNYEFTTSQIIQTLRNMNLTKIKEDCYVPSFERTTLTDSLHSLYSFNLDREILNSNNLKKIFKKTKN